jgi:hypothetical protein
VSQFAGTGISQSGRDNGGVNSELVLSVEDRLFQLWYYKVGHKQLLIRSTGTLEDQPQIDIVAKNVGFVSLPTVMQGIDIRKVTDEEERAAFYRSAGTKAMPDRQLFAIESSATTGHIVAGLIRHITYDGDSLTPCPLLI